MNDHAPMETFDTIVAGAGPAGGQCAKTLVEEGKRVLLLEKASNFSINNYSSGGAPLQIMKDFSLPDDLVGAYWNKLAIYTTHNVYTWQSAEPKGVILDFKKLRTHLADAAEKKGGRVLMDHAYIGHDRVHGALHVHIRNQATRQVATYKTKTLVDATGCERQVVAGKSYRTADALTATGIEYLVQTDAENSAPYAKTLTFFLGQKWMPQGYGWIFPMSGNQLKVGVIRYFPKEHLDPHTLSYKHYLETLIKEKIGVPDILDRHGKMLTYTWGQNDPLGSRDILATGDAISMLNPLASEGIRHALFSGRAAAENLLLERPLKDYAAELHRYCWPRWKLCEWLLCRYYRQTDDAYTELFLDNLRQLNFDQLLDMGFNYRIARGLPFYLRFTLQMAGYQLRKIFH